MNISLASTPFITQPNKLELAPTRINNSSELGISATQRVSRSQSRDVFQLDSKNKQVNTSTEPLSNNQLFSLNSNQNKNNTNNASISQYLETESFTNREALESLVGVDLFV